MFRGPDDTTCVPIGKPAAFQSSGSEIVGWLSERTRGGRIGGERCQVVGASRSPDELNASNVAPEVEACCLRVGACRRKGLFDRIAGGEPFT